MLAGLAGLQQKGRFKSARGRRLAGPRWTAPADHRKAATKHDTPCNTLRAAETLAQHAAEGMGSQSRASLVAQTCARHAVGTHLAEAFRGWLVFQRKHDTKPPKSAANVFSLPAAQKHLRHLPGPAFLLPESLRPRLEPVTGACAPVDLAFP